LVLTEGTAFAWGDHDVEVATAGMTAHFGKKNNEETAYTPGPKASKEARRLPRMLFVPIMLVEWLSRKPRTPWQLRQKICTLIRAQVLTRNEWQLALDWCSAAAQGLLTLKPESTDFIEDYFYVWQRRQLNKTLGQVHTPGAAGGIDSAVVKSVERLASATHQLAQGQAAQNNKKAAAQSTAQAQAAAAEDKDKKTYL